MKSPGRITALAVAMLAGVGMLSACSSGDSGSKDGKVTLVVASLIPGSGSVHGAWAPTSRDTRHAAAPGGTTDRQMGVAPDGRQLRFRTCFG